MIFYNLFVCLLLPFIFIFYFSKKKLNFDEIKERLGFVKRLQKNKYILIHAASVGEVKIASVLIKKLKNELKDFKIILSVLTPSGKKVAENENLDIEKILYLPVDFMFSIYIFFKKISPKLILLIETEFWPNLISIAPCKIVVVNGRISSKSYKFYLFFKPFLKKVLNKIELFLMRENIDSQRILNLGVDRKKVFKTGNMKYDLEFSEQLFNKRKTYEEFGLSEKSKVFVAGSIREGEEKLLIEAYLNSRERIKDLKFIIAPRHIERTKEIEKILQQKNINFCLKTSSAKKNPDCVILNTYGELFKAYYIADIVFIGGSLLPFGGHNIIEPASLGKVIIFGSYIYNFSEPAEMLLRNKSAIQVNNVDQLKNVIIDFFNNPTKYQKFLPNIKNVINELKKVTDKNINFIKQLI